MALQGIITFRGTLDAGLRTEAKMLPLVAIVRQPSQVSCWCQPDQAVGPFNPQPGPAGMTLQDNIAVKGAHTSTGRNGA